MILIVCTYHLCHPMLLKDSITTFPYFVLGKHEEFHRHVKSSSHHGWQNHWFHIQLYIGKLKVSSGKHLVHLTCEVVGIPLCNQIPALAMQPQGHSLLSFIFMFSFHVCEVNARLSYVEGHHEDQKKMLHTPRCHMKNKCYHAPTMLGSFHSKY